MPYYFMRDTPLQALEQLMMSQPGQKPRGGGIYRSPFHYTPKDVACEYCQNYVRKHPCRLCECTCLDERIEAGVTSIAGHQFIVGSLFHNFSILDKQDLVYILNRGQPVCNHDNCFAPHQFLESLLQLVFIFRICSCRSLIHNDDIRIL